MSSEKRHQPTARRLERAREEGNIAHSPVLTQGVAAIVSLVFLRMSGSQYWVDLRLLVESAWRGDPREADLALKQAVRILLSFLGSWLILVLPATLVVHAMQTRGFFALASVCPSAARLSPSRVMTSFRATCFKIVTAPLKLTFLSSLFFWKLGSALMAFPALFWREPWNVTIRFLSALSDLAISSAFLITAWGAGAWCHERRRRLRRLAMSDEELRKEQLESEGSPFVRAARRQMHEILVTQDLAARVRRAKVIVVEKA